MSNVVAFLVACSSSVSLDVDNQVSGTAGTTTGSGTNGEISSESGLDMGSGTGSDTETNSGTETSSNSTTGWETTTSSNSTVDSESESSAETDATSSESDATESQDSGESTDSSGDSTTGEDCALPKFEDDLVLVVGEQNKLMAEAMQAIESDDYAMICGDGYVATVPLMGGETQTLPIPELKARCTSMTSVGSNRVLATTAGGEILLFEISGDGSLAILDHIQRNTETFYGVAYSGDVGWIAAGTNGVLRLKIDGNKLEVGAALPGAKDARDVAIVDEGLLVADGMAGIRLLNLDGNGSIDEKARPGVTSRLQVKDSRVVALRGASGFDVFDIEQEKLVLRSQHTPPGTMLDARFIDGTLLLASARSLIRYRLEADGDAILVAHESRVGEGKLAAPWIRSVIYKNDRAFALTDDSLIPVTLGGAIDAPNVEFNTSNYSLWAEPGQSSFESLVAVYNSGPEELVITGVDFEGPFTVELPPQYLNEREGCPDHLIAYGNRTFYVLVTFHATDDKPVSGAVHLHSNDPDHPRLSLNLRGNPTLPSAGEIRPNFAMLQSDGKLFRQEDHDEVLLLKIFDST